MINVKKRIFGVVLSLSLVVIGTLTVHAGTHNVIPVDEVFPEEQVEQLAMQQLSGLPLLL